MSRGRALVAAARRNLARRLGRGGPDAGSAIVEFLGVALLLLVPVVYLVLVMARMQSAAFAVDGAAREAVRAVVTSEAAADVDGRAVAAVALALADQGLDPELAATALTLRCAADDCLSPGSTVTVVVDLDVVLPGVPGWLHDAVPLAVPVGAVATGSVERFTGTR